MSTTKHDITELVKRVEIQRFEDSGHLDLNVRFKEEAEVGNNLIVMRKHLVPEWNESKKQELEQLFEKAERLMEDE